MRRGLTSGRPLDIAYKFVKHKSKRELVTLDLRVVVTWPGL